MSRRFPVTPSPDEDGVTISYNASDLNNLIGTTLVIGETVFLSDEGVNVVASASGQYDEVNAYSFFDTDEEDIGGLYARDDAGQNIVALRVIDQAGNGDDTTLSLLSEAEAGATAQIQIGPSVTGQTDDCAITFEKSASKSEIDILSGDRVRVYPILQLLGSGLTMCEIYMSGSKFVIKYQDGATTRYKYLDLSGTGVTWVHTTTAP